MTWFAFSGLNGGKAVDLAGTQEKQAVAEGFHGYGTEAQAEAHPNSVNSLTRYLADGWIADYKAAVAEQAQPGGANGNILNPVTAAKAAVTGGLNLTGLAAVGDFFSRLTEKSTWIRVGEVLLGAALIIVSAAKLFAGTPAGKAATSIGMKAAIL